MLPKITSPTPSQSASPMPQTRRPTEEPGQKAARESAIRTLEVLLRVREEGLQGAAPQAIEDMQVLLFNMCRNLSFAAVERKSDWKQPAIGTLTAIKKQWDHIKSQTPAEVHQTVDRLIAGTENALLENDLNAFRVIFERLSHIFSGPSSIIPDKKTVWVGVPRLYRDEQPQVDPSSYLPECLGLERKFLKRMEEHAKYLPPHEAKELMSHVVGLLDPIPKEKKSADHLHAMNFLLVKEKFLRDTTLPAEIINIIGEFAVNSRAATVTPAREPERVVPPRKSAASSFKDKVEGHLASLRQPAIKNAFLDGDHKKFEIFLQNIGKYRKIGNHSKADEKRLRQAQNDLQKSLSNKNHGVYCTTLEAFHKALPDGTDISDGNFESKETGGRHESRLSKISKAASNLLSPRGKKK